MVTKGIITAIPIGEEENKYLVRLPFFEDATQDSADIVYECTLSEPSGIIQGYSVGDIVYCTFEDNNLGRPVIIGKLFSRSLENIGAEINTLELDVGSRANLPANTSIGNATPEDVANISNIKNKLDKMGGTIFGALTLDNTVNLRGDRNVNLLDSSGAITKTITTDDWLNGSGGGGDNYVLKSGDTMTGSLNIGTNTTNSEKYFRVRTNSGDILLDSVGNANGDGKRGIWAGTHGTGSGKWALEVDTNNNVVVNGSSSLNVLKAGDTMTGDLNFSANKGINFVTHGRLYWKENGYGDQFAIVPAFTGYDDSNLLKIQSAVGGSGTTPDMTDKVTIAGKTGNVNLLTGDLTLTAGSVNTAGAVNTVGDLNLKTSGTSSNDSADIVWWYGNSQEKMRIWSQNDYTAKDGPNFREYDSSGTLLFNGKLPLSDGTSATGTWGINITGNAPKDGDGNTISSTYIKKVNADYYNVLEHGLYNDGITDNSSALASLITTCYFNKTGLRSGARTIFFPDGIYKFNSTVNIPYNKPVNFLLSPNAVLTTSSALEGIIEFGSKANAAAYSDGYPPVIFDGGIIDCTSAKYGLVHWSGRPLAKVQNVTFQNIGVGIGLYLRKSDDKGSGDCKVINCTFNGVTSATTYSADTNTAIKIDSDDNEINNCRVHGVQMGVYQDGGATYYNDVHFTMLGHGNGTPTVAQVNSSVGVYINSGHSYFNNSYFDTFGSGVYISPAGALCEFVNTIFYAYRDGSSGNSVTYKFINIANNGFPWEGHISLVNCWMGHASMSNANLNYIYADIGSWNSSNVTALYTNNCIKMIDCTFNFTDVPLTDLARNICAGNKKLEIRSNVVSMTKDAYYPIAVVRCYNLGSYKIDFDLHCNVSGSVEFLYFLSGSTPTFHLLSKDININPTTTQKEYSFALVNPFTDANGATWSYLCLKQSSTGTRYLQGRFDFNNNGAVNCIYTNREYGSTTQVSNVYGTPLTVTTNVSGDITLDSGKFTDFVNNNTTNYRLNGTAGTNYFYVIRGDLVFVTFNVYCESATLWPSTRSFKGLPAPLLNGADAVFCTLGDQAVGGNAMIAAIQSDGTVQCTGGTTGHYYYGTGVYIRSQ